MHICNLYTFSGNTVSCRMLLLGFLFVCLSICLFVGLISFSREKLLKHNWLYQINQVALLRPVCVCGFLYHCVWRIALFCYELASASGLCRRIAFLRLWMTGGGQFRCMPPQLIGCALANLLTLYMFVVVVIVIVDVTAVVLGGKVVDWLNWLSLLPMSSHFYTDLQK